MPFAKFSGSVTNQGFPVTNSPRGRGGGVENRIAPLPPGNPCEVVRGEWEVFGGSCPTLDVVHFHVKSPSLQKSLSDRSNQVNNSTGRSERHDTSTSQSQWADPTMSTSHSQRHPSRIQNAAPPQSKCYSDGEEPNGADPDTHSLTYFRMMYRM